MAKRKSHRRKKNPMRTTGAILLQNPRRKHTKRKKNAGKRKATKVKAFASRAGRKHSKWGSISAHKRRVKNPRKRKTVKRKKNAMYVRPRMARFALHHPGWAAHHPAAAAHMLRNPKRRKHVKRKKNAIQINRKRHVRRRKNPAIVGEAQSMVRKLPLVGGFLADVIGLLAPAALGAISVEPTMQLMKYAGPYVPQLPASVAYAGTGLILAALVMRFAPLDASMKKDIAIALVSGGGAVGYYKWRTKTDAKMAGELGVLHGFGALDLHPMAGELGMDDYMGEGDMADALGDGGAYSVVPFGDASGSFGAIELHDAYAGAPLGDSYSCPGDMSYGEIHVALSGPSAWGRAFGRKRLHRKHSASRSQQQSEADQSDGAGEKGHRWGWLIRFIGFERFQRLAALPADQRQALIHQLKQQAQATIDSQTGHGGTSGDLSGSAGFGSAGFGASMGMAGWGTTHVFGV